MLPGGPFPTPSAHRHRAPALTGLGLAARTAPSENVGTALTIMNSLGFALTIVSIQVLNVLRAYNPDAFWPVWLLAIGPIAGLLALRPLLRPAA